VIRLRRQEDDGAIVDLINRLNRDQPEESIGFFRHRAGLCPSDGFEEHWIGEVDGLFVAYGLVANWWLSGQHESCFVTVAVEPAWQQRGVGAQMYNHVAARAPRETTRRLYGYVRGDEPHAQAFAERRGFIPTGHVEKSSRLRVAGADTSALIDMERRLAADAIVIRTLAAIISEDTTMLHAVYAMNEEVAVDTPRSEPRAPFSFELWQDLNLGGPGQSADLIWVALHDGRPIGLARIFRRGRTVGCHGFTGVARPYRSRGIARALKLSTIAWAQANGIEYLYTENDVSNAPMLAINGSLGYEPLPSYIEVRKIIAFD
jgi:GNAT superfamily N-acetyltransferase